MRSWNTQCVYFRYIAFLRATRKLWQGRCCLDKSTIWSMDLLLHIMDENLFRYWGRDILRATSVLCLCIVSSGTELFVLSSIVILIVRLYFHIGNIQLQELRNKKRRKKKERERRERRESMIQVWPLQHYGCKRNYFYQSITDNLWPNCYSQRLGILQWL